MSRIRVLVVDDETLVREILADYLVVDTDLEVVGEAGDGNAAVLQAAALQPDVILMDMQMPGKDGVAATAEIRARYPQIAVLGLTSFETDRYVVSLLRAGAPGYLIKDTSPKALRVAIRTVAAGGSVLSPEVTRYVVQGLVESRPPLAAAERAFVEQFTERELEVLQLISKGKSNREIAEHLWLGEATVKSHIRTLYMKLQVSNRVQALVKGIEYGLVGSNKP